MKNVSELLKNTRKQLGFSQDKVSSETKIKKPLIQALEEGNFSKFPSISTTKGFIKIYAKYLGLDPNKVGLLYKRESKEVESHMMVKKQKKVKIPFMFNGRIAFTIFFILLMVIIMGIYAIHEYIVFKTPPTLNITKPKISSLSVYKPNIQIIGKTNAGNNVFIGGYKVTNINPNGSFNITVGLQNGLNKIDISAVNPLGIKNSHVFDIRYINLKLLKIENASTFAVTILDKNSSTFINATTGKTILFNHILKTGEKITLKSDSIITLNIGNIQNISITYNQKQLPLSGYGFVILILKYQNGKVTISKVS